jgi:hypothetical protein
MLEPGSAPDAVRVAATRSGELPAFAVSEPTRQDREEVNNCPDSQPAGSQQLQNSRAHFAYIKAVNTQETKEETQDKGEEFAFAAHR